VALFRRDTAASSSRPGPARPIALPQHALQEQSLEMLTAGCVIAIRSAGEYALELEPGDTKSLTADLAQLSLRLPALNTSGPFVAEEYRSVQAGMGAACKEYGDRSKERLAQLRRQVDAAAELAQTAVSEFAETLLAGNAAYEEGILEQLEALKTAAATGDLAVIRGTLGNAAAGIRRSQLQLRRSQQLVMIQLQDEIRVLRTTIETNQRERERDPASGVLRRDEIDWQIRSRALQHTPFSVLVISVHNLEALEAAHSPEVFHSLLHALLKRLSAIVGPAAEIGRWNPAAFAVILPMAPAQAPPVCAQVSSRLPGAYAVQKDGRSLTLMLDLSAGIVDVPASD
jgi:GGDEF domain-containing protein